MIPPSTVADPEANLGGGGSRGPKGRVGKGTGGVSPPVGGGSGKFFKNEAKWCNLECKSSLLNSLKLSSIFSKIAPKMHINIIIVSDGSKG